MTEFFLDKPKRRYELTVKITGDTWASFQRALDYLAELDVLKGESLSQSTAHQVDGASASFDFFHNITMTPEKYAEAVAAYDQAQRDYFTKRGNDK
jgi:hypothetical protein